MTYVRFVIPHKDSRSLRRQGLFMAMERLKNDDALLSHERATWDEIYEWFCKNLEKPSCLRRSKGRPWALSWFKDSALEHIRRMRAIAEILREHDIPVHTLTTEKPGFILYEDEFQVAAEPFSETGA